MAADPARPLSGAAGRSVLHVSQPSDAGVARVVLELATYQSQQGWDVRVATPPGGWLAEQAARRGVPSLPWAARRAPHLGSPRDGRHLSALIRDTAPDVVHLHSSTAGMLGRPRRPSAGAPLVVFQPHAWSWEALPTSLGALARRFERSASRRTDLLVCVSEAEREAGVRAGVRGPCVVVPNGVDVDHYAPRPRDAARRALRLPPTAPLVVCVGRLARQKGQDLLLQAWPQVRAAVPGAQLVLVGSGPAEAELRTTSRDLPSVTLAGPTDDARDWYAAADVVALPSRWEGMPLVALEASAMARSVVAFAAAGLAEVLTPGGPVAPVGDVPALARLLVDRLVDVPAADREGRLARERVVRGHDLAGSLRATDDAVRQALHAHRLRPALRSAPATGGSA